MKLTTGTRPSAILRPILIALFLAHPLAAQSPTSVERQWYRGNTHVHTLNSDGNASPSEVARWYRDHGYAFLVISDHEVVTDITTLNTQLGIAGRFIVIPGQEITQQVVDSTRLSIPRQAHVGAIGIRNPILPLGRKGLASGVSISATYERNIAEVRAAGGVAQVNHPNFRWSVGPDDMARLPDSTLFEVWNAQPRINNLGGTDAAGNTSLSTEALWDTVLTRGKLLFGVASDDAHKFLPAQLEDPEATRPGGGWVMVRAESLTPEAIIAALKAGDFYASTGIVLEDLQAHTTEVSLRIARTDARDDRRFSTRFIGNGGRVLAISFGTTARYKIRGDEGYVRAAISDSNGSRAWVQPMIVRPR